MRMIDFEYDGRLLSSFSMVPAGFNMDSDEQDVGNRISMSDLKVPNKETYYSLGSRYEEPFRKEFEITKIDCKNGEFILNDKELNDLIRWLNRKEYRKFKPIYENGEFEGAYYMATFNVSPLNVGQQVIGLKLEMETNAPYAFKENGVVSMEFKLDSDTLTVTDPSNEIGAKNAQVQITCMANGDLTITNTLDPNNDVVIKNCKMNEVITLYGDTKIIKSNSPSHTTLPNDFNYNFLRIVSTDDSNQNIIKSSINCKMDITYKPIMKVGLVV